MQETFAGELLRLPNKMSTLNRPLSIKMHIQLIVVVFLKRDIPTSKSFVIKLFNPDHFSPASHPALDSLIILYMGEWELETMLISRHTVNAFFRAMPVKVIAASI